MTHLVLVRCDPFVGQVAEHLPQHIGIFRLFKIGDHDLLGVGLGIRGDVPGSVEKLK